jgi:hypothetical protein
MLPGFTALGAITPHVTPPIAAAGVWDTPSQEECRYARTDTFCTLLVMWCKEVYVCNNNTVHGYEKTKTPYPCGVCFGISDPSDW